MGLAESLEAADGDIDMALEQWESTQLHLGRQLLARKREIGNRSQVWGTWIAGDPAFVYGPGR
jgi:hypothetical protein